VVAVVLSQDPELGPACAAELRVAGTEVHLVANAAQVAALGAGGATIEALVAVPRQPEVGKPGEGDPAAFASETTSAVGEVLPAMVERGQGRVVVVVTATGLPGQTWADGTGTAMWGLVGLARSSAREVAASGVTVNVVRTGALDQSGTEDGVAAVVAQTPLKRTGTVDDVAAAVGFLCSAEAGYVTGVVLPVDGGLSMGSGT
jgi:hypothetical protein